MSRLEETLASDSSHTSASNQPDNDIVQRRLHPDTLYDEEYVVDPIDLRGYAPVAGAFEPGEGAANGVRLATPSGATACVEACGRGTLRLRVAPDPSAFEPSLTERLGLLSCPRGPHDFSAGQKNGVIEFRIRELRLSFVLASGDFRVFNAAGLPLVESVGGGARFSPEPPEYGGHRLCADFRRDEAERLVGFGGRIAPPNRAGATADIFSVKAGKKSGDYGGFPLPFFMSGKGYGVFLNNPWPHVYFDMGRSRPDRWRLHAPGGGFDLFVLNGPELADILRRFTDLVGRPDAPPRWALGFWVSCVAFDSADKALEDARRLRDENYPCDVFVFDAPWRSGKGFAAVYENKRQYVDNDPEWHPDFGDGPAMIRELARRGFRTCLHVNSRSFSPETRARALERGLVRRQEEETVPRLTYPEAEAFYEKLFAPRIREGVALWWTDHSDRVSGEIRPGVPSRNLFGALWNRLLAGFMARHNHDKGAATGLCLSRGGGIGSQPWVIPWPGDTRFGIDAMKEDIWFLLSAGLGGFGFSSVDLGGFTSRGEPSDYVDARREIAAEAFDDENICRRLCQMILFTPVPRIHNSALAEPKFPWHCSPRARDLYRRALEERYRLTPYIYSCALEHVRTGAPIVRPLAWRHRADERAWDVVDELYLGDWLLVAPVTDPGRDARAVYLPEGRWIHLWTDEIVDGPAEVEAPAPLYEIEGLPVYVRAGAMIPRQPLTPCLEDRPPDALTIDVYPHGESRCVLRETDTLASRWTCRETDDAVLLELENNARGRRPCEVRAHTRRPVQAVEVEGDDPPALRTDRPGVAAFEVVLAPGRTTKLRLRLGAG